MDTPWEEVYASGGHRNTWPWSDLVSLFHRWRDSLPALSHLRVLELGSGTGNNYRFFQSMGCSYTGVDVSPSAVEYVHRQWPETTSAVTVADLNTASFGSQQYEIIVDRAAVTHLDSNGVQHAVEAAYESLVPGGLYLGVDWFSKKHSSFVSASEWSDANSRRGLAEGQFVGLGTVHFADEADLREIFHRFELVELSEKVVGYSEPPGFETFASWNLVAKKPS